jgi:hypothetical protein
MDVQRRILTFNVFITPIFSFVYNSISCPPPFFVNTALLCTVPYLHSLGLLGHTRSSVRPLVVLDSGNLFVTPGCTTSPLSSKTSTLVTSLVNLTYLGI